MRTLRKTGRAYGKFKELKAYIPLAVLAVFCACASTDGGAGGPVGKVIKSITGEPVVPRAANRILVVDFRGAAGGQGLRDTLGIRVRELLAADGRLAVVADEAGADLVLEGVVTGYETRPLRYNEMGLALSKRMRITVSVRLFDRDRDREIFFEREIQAFEEFSDTEPPVVPEAAALDRVINALAKRISQQTIRGSYTELLTPVEKGRK
jgi:hypothetical protein